MRGRFRLDTRKHCLSKNGYPLVIYLSKDSKTKFIKTGYYSFKKDWNEKDALPFKTHPNFLSLLNYLEVKKPRLLRVLDMANYEVITFDFAAKFIKGMESGVFFIDAMIYYEKHNLTRNYKIALASFNEFFPDYPYSYITKEIAQSYRTQLLNKPVRGRKRSPNGVLSYLSSLTAIWNKMGRSNNPFAGVRVNAVPTRSKALTIEDVKKIINNDYKPHSNNNGGGVYHYLNYWLLCFYLGGIDLVDLANLKRSDVVNGRVEFIRNKGGTNVFVSNKIFPQAQAILDEYSHRTYLVPIKKINYEALHGNLSRYYGSIQKVLELSKKPYSKSPRYTFINFARQRLIDERICIEIVGHSQSSTHSIYKDEFSYSVRDAAHAKIINLE